MGEERNDIIVLTDEEGAEHEFQVVDYFNVDEKEYAILLPMNDFEEDDEEGEAPVSYTHLRRQGPLRCSERNMAI